MGNEQQVRGSTLPNFSWLRTRASCVLRVDPVLALALGLAFIFCLHGIRWGRVECWNHDQMALRGLSALKPGDYEKPPFHTYLNHLVVMWPLEGSLLLAGVGKERWKIANEGQLLASRLLVVALFLGTISLVHDLSARSFGRFTARLLALTLATSAGYVAFAHFLTADVPLLFWMTLAFWFCDRVRRNPELSNYRRAGFLIGLTTATKYNGLAVGIALVLAHLFAIHRQRWREIVLSRNLAIGLAMILVGFFAGCPTALIQPWRFWSDFMYNYTVTPRYAGQTEHLGYLSFFAQIPELVGTPGTVLVVLGLLASSIILLRGKPRSEAATQVWLLAGGVVLLYCAKMGSLPRTPARFVLPVLPFLVLLIGPAMHAVAPKWKYLCVPFLLLLIYNGVCSYYVGTRLNQDPRNAAQTWVEENIHSGIMESSADSPHWARLPRFAAAEINLGESRPRPAPPAKITDWRMPHDSGRAELFPKLFAGNKWVEANVARKEAPVNESLFSEKALRGRNPGFITVHSTDYEVPSFAVQHYYRDLLGGKFSYEIVFDGETMNPPRWVYPRSIDFLRGRMIILKKR